MATTYVVVEAKGKPDDTDRSPYYMCGQVEASNATQACRKVAETLTDTELDGGVTLIAVPARNWTSGQSTFAAKTERKLIRS